MRSYDLNINHINKSLFVIFEVESVGLKDKKIYINAKGYKDVHLAAVLSSEYDLNPYESLVSRYLIAFGKINYSTKINKFFLNLNNDYQFEIMETQKAINYFKDVEYRYYDFKQYNKNNTKQFSNINIVSKEDVIEASKVLTYNDKVDLNDEINISKLVMYTCNYYHI